MSAIPAIYNVWNAAGGLFGPRSHGPGFYPQWLLDAAGVREKEIMFHPYCVSFCVDADDNLLPKYQRVIACPTGFMTYDVRSKSIIN
jgi:hypothetical protein